MNTSGSNRLALGTLILAVALGGSACYVESDVVPVAAYGYQPVLHDGYVVYYDGGGRPYYYANGATVWISPGHPRYGYYQQHWQTYGPAYGHWYASYGPRYYNYRARGR